jgi:prophage DNA circulation protein
MEVPESTVLLAIEDRVVIAEPIASVVGAGGVVISAAGTVTFLKATPVLVYTHKHTGDCSGK